MWYHVVMLNTRLPVLPASMDKGFVYAVRRGEAYKIGFSREGLRRRVRDSGGVLVLAIATGQQPASLERAIHERFEGKRLPPQGAKAGDKQEWFRLDGADLDWLRGLKEHVTRAQDVGFAESG